MTGLGTLKIRHRPGELSSVALATASTASVESNFRGTLISGTVANRCSNRWTSLHRQAILEEIAVGPALEQGTQ